MRKLDPYRLKRNFALFLVILLSCCDGLNASACKRGCPVSDRGAFRYRPGSVYNYNFDSTITISLASPNSDETSLKVQGRANVFAEPNCGYTLTLDRVQVVQSKDANTQYKLTEGIDKPVQFTMSNGELENQICTDPADTDYSVNLKRAIISMLQKSDKSYETDIFGVCPTTTSTAQNGKIELVTKIRNLNACKYREVLSNGFITGLVNERAGIKSTPLLTGDYSQEQEISDGIVERVELHEDYKFVPLANSQTGAGVRAKIRTTLKRTKTAAGAAPALASGISQSIIFRNPRHVPVDNMGMMRTVLATTVNDMQDHTSPKSAKQLTELIRLMRNAGQQQLSTLYRDVRSGSVHPSKDLARRVFLDALFRAGTDDSIATIAKLIDAEMDDNEKRLAYISFNLVENVDEKALASIDGLLSKNPPKEAYLSVGHLVSKYCSQHECEQNRAIRSIASKFAGKLGNCQPQTKQQEDVIVNALKGIGNSGALAGNAIDKLTQCTANKIPARVRVAALQALQSASCDPKAQSTALQTLKNRNEDSEIRIEAYLALVACPSATVANEIAEIVNSEPVYQVGGFIASHLRSIRDSTDATREAARQHFSNIRITKKFPMDPRRYSFNQELSYAFESLGLSASADYSLIYSQRGFLPRSARLNVTTEIFGHDFNVFEFNARQENLELLLQHYFGPKGFFTERSHDAPTRQKRAASREEINAFAQKLKQFGPSANENLLLDYSIKLFGSEMVFLSLGEHIPRDSDALTQKLSSTFDDLTNKAKNFEYDCGSHSLFLDSELVYPTGMGFPLQMVAQGAAIGRVHLAASIDLKSKNWKNEKYRVKVVPSTTIDVNGLMKIDAQVLSTGLKVRGSIHTSTGSDVTVQVKDGQEYNIDIDVPFKKQEIINFNHEIEFVVEDPAKETVHYPLGGRRNVANDEKCFDQLSMFGLTICGIISRPVTDEGALSFPLNGPTKVSFNIETENKIHLNLANRHENGKHMWTVLYDTPGSQTPHTTELKFEVSTSPKWYGRASFKHPQKFLALEAGLQNDDTKLALYGQYEHDSDVSSAKIGFKKIGANEYEPLILITGKDKMLDNLAGYRATGKIIAQETDVAKRYQFQNIQILNPANRATVLNGWIELGSGPGFGMDMNIRNTENKEYNVKSKLLVQTGHYIASGTILNGANPSSSGSFSWELQHQEGKVKNDLSIGYGQDLRYGYELHNDIAFEADKSKPRSAKFENSLISKSPSAKLKLNGQYSQNAVEYDFDANFGRGRIGSTLNLRRNQKSAGDYEAEMTLVLNNHKADVKSKRTSQDGNSVIDHSLKTSWGTTATLKGKYSNRWTATDAHVDLQGSLQPTDKDETIGLTVVLNATPKNTQGTTKVTRGAAELLTLNANYVRGDNANAKFDVSIKDMLVGRGEAKWKGGAGDLSMLFNLKKLTRKIKFESKYNMAAPTYNIDATIFYDFEKDNAKKMTLSSKNQVQDENIDSDTALEFGADRYSFDLKKVADQKAGVINGNFNLGLPSGRKIIGDFERKITKKDDTSDGNMMIKLTDQTADGKKRSLQVDAKGTGVNLKTRTFDIYEKITYITPEGKDAVIEVTLKHMPNGANKMAESNFKASGSLIPNPMDLSIMVSEYTKDHAVFRVSGKYGNLLNGNMNGNYKLGARAEPATYEIQMHLDAPNTEFRSYKLESSGRLVQPEVEDGVYDGKIHVQEEFGDQSMKFDGWAKVNAKHGTWSIEYDAPKVGPGKLDGSYVREEKEDQGKYQMNIAYNYGQSKTITMNADASYMQGKSMTLHYALQTPNEQARKVEIIFKGEKSDQRTYNSHLQVNHNDKTYGLNTVSTLSDSLVSADINMEYLGKTSKLSGSVERLGERKGRAKLQIENLGDFSFDGSAEGSAQSFENFYLKVDVDSKKMNLDQVHLDVNAQPKSGGKGVEFKATAAGKNVLSGTAEYTVKNDKNKVIVEGKGNVQFYEKPRQVSFTLVRQAYEAGRDSEAGYSVAFNGHFGPREIVAEFKMTNKNLIMKLASCEDKKQCSNIEIRSVTVVKKEDNIQHKLMVLIDLREMGWPHEFELQSKVSNVGLRVEQELGITIKSQNNVQYQLHSHVRQRESAIVFTTPNRKIALETVYQIPKEIFGKYEASSTLYLNKDKRPDEKSTLSLTGDLSHVQNTAINMIGKAHFEHPGVKPLIIAGYFDLNNERKLAQGTLEFDIFKKPGQKIIATSKYGYGGASDTGVNITVEASVKSADNSFEYGFDSHTAFSMQRYEISTGAALTTPHKDLRTSFYFTANPHSFEFVTVAFNEPVWNVIGKLSAKESEIKAQYNTFGGKPIQIKGKTQGLTMMTVDIDWRDLFELDSKLALGKEATMVMRTAGKELFNGRTALDPGHFLSTQYKVNEPEIKAFMKKMEDQVITDGQQVRAAIEQRFKTFGDRHKKMVESFKDSLPDLSALRESYERNLKEVADEIAADPSLKNIVEFYKRIFEAVSRALSTVMKVASENYQKLAEVSKEIYERLSKLFSERILPIFQKTAENISAILQAWYNEVLKLALGLMESVAKTLKTFEGDFNKIGKALTEYTKQFSSAFSKLFEVLQKEFEDVIKLANEFIEALPGLEDIQTAVKKYVGGIDGYVRQGLHMLDDVLLYAEDFLPTQELKDFTRTLHEYLSKKIAQETVNDLESIRKIYMALVNAIRSIWMQFKSKDTTKTQLYPIPINLDFFRQVPFLTTMKFSPINFLKNEQWGNLRNLFVRSPAQPASADMPPELRGHIADGEHIFTFDGRHMTFPGSCSYVLVQGLDGNFAVVANMQDGKMKSVTVADKSNVVEMLPDAQLKLNGNTAEYPVHKEDMHAWRRYYSVFARSEYGVEVKCSLDLRICHVHVSGYYTGKTRGILGNGNNEPYDDYTLPNGKITDNYAEVGNSYAVSGNCAPISTSGHQGHGHDSPVCKEIFGDDSSLMLGYLFLDPSNYKEACNHAVEKAQDKEDAACNIALTYASAARDQMIPVDMPHQCVKCKNAGERELGDDFETKTPQKKADVVFVVDTNVDLNNGLVQNVINDLRTTLKQRDMTDVNIAVILYNENMRYPQILTTNGNLNFNGKFDKVDVSNVPRYDDRIKTGIRSLPNTYLDQIDKIINQAIATSDARAFNLAMEYPFRPDANRAIIAVRGDQLEYSNMMKLVGAKFSQEVAKAAGISLHLIGPVKDFELTGRSQQQGNVVGFDKRIAVMLGDAKKRVNFGSADVRQQIRYAADMGLDFVLDDDGYVFVMQNYDAVKEKPKERKQYTMAAAVAISDQLARTEIVNQCECRMRHGLIAEERCRAVQKNLLPQQLKRPAARG